MQENKSTNNTIREITSSLSVGVCNVTFDFCSKFKVYVVSWVNPKWDICGSTGDHSDFTLT